MKSRCKNGLTKLQQERLLDWCRRMGGMSQETVDLLNSFTAEQQLYVTRQDWYRFGCKPCGDWGLMPIKRALVPSVEQARKFAITLG